MHQNAVIMWQTLVFRGELAGVFAGRQAGLEWEIKQKPGVLRGVKH